MTTLELLVMEMRNAQKARFVKSTPQIQDRVNRLEKTVDKMVQMKKKEPNQELEFENFKSTINKNYNANRH